MIVEFSQEGGSRFFATINGRRFFVGKKVTYEGTNCGLANSTGDPGQCYDRNQYRPEFGFWADFLHPTATAEGGFFHTLNTYDLAHFTFGFLQFAAHVAGGDFVAYFRELLRLPRATEYFPDLRLVDGHINRLEDAGLRVLETDTSVSALIAYLNPTVTSVEDIEVVQAAKFIDWSQTDPEHRRVQVEVGMAQFKSKMKSYAARYGLDGAPDVICLLVADIRHQGRAKSPEIIAALESPDPFQALMSIGEDTYASRIMHLRTEIGRLVAEGRLGVNRYSTVLNDFESVGSQEEDDMGKFYQEPGTPVVFTNGISKRTCESLGEMVDIATKFAPRLIEPTGAITVEQVPAGFLDGIPEAQ